MRRACPCHTISIIEVQMYAERVSHCSLLIDSRSELDDSLLFSVSVCHASLALLSSYRFQWQRPWCGSEGSRDPKYGRSCDRYIDSLDI